MDSLKLAQRFVEDLPAEHLLRTLFKQPPSVKDPASAASQAALAAAEAKRARKAAKRGQKG